MNVTEALCSNQPHSIDFGLINMLHRGPDQIPVCVKGDDGELRDLFTVPAWEASHIFPQVAHHLERDSFFSINSYWLPNGRLKSRYSITSNRNTQRWLLRPFRQRRKQYLQRINAIHCDLDCHSIGLSPGCVFGKLLDMQEAGELPRISAIMRSGRGVWVFWRVHDKLDFSQGQKATNEAVGLGELLNKTVQTRLSHLGADSQSVDLTRICRIPGSVNSKSGGKVECWQNTDEHGQVATYTLNELMLLFGVCPPERTRPPARSGRPVPAQLNPRLGAQARWKKEVERFEKLWKHRRVFREGVRGAAVYLYRKFLNNHKYYSGGLSDEDIKRKMDELFDSLEQFDQSEDTKTVPVTGSRNYSRRQFDTMLAKECNAKPLHTFISERLRITGEESALTGWPAFGEEPKLSCSAKRKMRRDLIRMWFIENDEPVPPYRELADRISNHDPRLKCAFRTVCDDCNEVMGSINRSVVQLQS
jgi:hypothetical protein